MKKITPLLFFIFSASFLLGHGQSKLTKYAIVFEDSLGRPYKNQKKRLTLFLKDSSYFIYQGKGREIATLDTLKGRKDATKLPDSIHSVFKIKNIVKKKNNYKIRVGRLARQTIFLINVENIDTIEKYPQHIRLLSVNGVNDKQTKIEVGQEYEMTIYSFFEKDCCRPIEKEGKTIYLTRKPDEHFGSILYEDIWIPYIDISSYNMFETPNLKGLYYIKPE